MIAGNVFVETVTVLPGAGLKPRFVVSGANELRKFAPALVQVTPSVDE